MMGRHDAGTAATALRPRLLALLETGDVDAALQAGLMQFAVGDDPEDAPLRAAQEQLRIAWATRERHRARTERLDRQARERAARRAASSLPASAAPAPVTASAGPMALPPAAAAALARARARAGGQAG